jgi:hypothetical protein
LWVKRHGLWEILEEELDAFFRAAFDLGKAIWCWEQKSAAAAFVVLDAVDIDPPTGEFSAKRYWISGQFLFKRGAAAALTGTRPRGGLELGEEFTHCAHFAELTPKCT